MQDSVCSVIKMKPPVLSNSGVLYASGTTVPSAITGYQTGCIFQKTDGGAGTSLYVNEGNSTSCSFQAISALTAAQEALLGATAGTVTASKAVIPDAYNTSRWGGFNTGAALTDAVSFATVPDTWSDGQLDVFSIFGGTGTDLTSAKSAKVARFRHVVLTSSGTIAQETYGAVGQLVVRGTTLTHLHSGLMGTFEGHTSGVVSTPAYRYGTACVTGRLGGGGAITATTPIAGFSAVFNGAALAGGSSTAFAATNTSTGEWGCLLGVTHAGSGLHNGVNIAGITGGPTDGTADGVIYIDVGGTTYYALLHTAAHLTGE